MKVTDQQREEFIAVAKPLIKWMNENCHPHTTTIVTCVNAELLEGVCAFHTEEFLRD